MRFNILGVSTLYVLSSLFKLFAAVDMQYGIKHP